MEYLETINIALALIENLSEQIIQQHLDKPGMHMKRAMVRILIEASELRNELRLTRDLAERYQQ